MNITEAFRRRFENELGPWKIGQVVITPISGRTCFFSLNHIEDGDETILEPSTDPFKMRHWVKQDSQGKFRALKGEKNLPRGWIIKPLDIFQLKEALDIVYPTAIANWLLREDLALRVTSFPETAGRQTGMYRITGITTDVQREEVTDELCRARCLKQRLWNGESQPPEDGEIPLLCPEVCNLFIASCRAKIKGKSEEES